MKRERKIITNALKFGLVIGLLFFLAKKGFLSVEETKKAMGEFRFMIPAFLAMSIATFLGMYRWHLLLQAQGIILPLVRTVELCFVGIFFNIALPGAVSGDVVKAIYVGKEVEGRRATAFGSILFDRVAGSSALIFVSCTAWLFSLGAPWSSNLLHSIQFIVVLAATGILIFYAYLFMVKENHDPLMILFKRFENRFNFVGSFKRIYEGIKSYQQHRSTVFKTLGISFVIHLLVTSACLLFALALGQFQIPSLAVFIVVPLALLVTAIPVMPAGVGTGHAAFLALFSLIGSRRGADVFNLFVFFQFLVGMIGGLVYLRFKSVHTDMNTFTSGQNPEIAKKA